MRSSLLRFERLAPLIIGLLLASALPAGSETRAPATPEEVVKRAEAAFRALQDYECLATSESRLGKKSQSCVERIWFRKPGQIRIRVVKGDHRGSEVAIDAKRKVRGHAGGLLRPIVIGVGFNDRRLKSLRGTHISELHWGSFLEKLRERMALTGAKSVLGDRSGPDDPYELTVTYTREGLRMREIYRFDPRLWVMVEGEVFEDEVRVDRIAFSEIKLDPGLEERWFRL